MLRSFKLKMALFAVCTSGLLLLAFASLFMSVIRRAGVERIDRHLYALAEAQLRRPLPTTHWPQFSENLTDLYGENNRRQFLVKVVANDGTSVYTSSRWPTALNAVDLKTADLEALPERPSRPPDRPGWQLGRPESQPKPLRLYPFRPGDEPPPRRLPVSRPKFLTAHADCRSWRFAMMRNPNVTLLVGTDMAELQTELTRFRTLFAVAGPLGLLLLATGGWFLAGQALSPVRILTRIAGGMTVKGLSQRVQAPGADREFQALIDVINSMLNRLETSFNQAARFSADAAHELKTPLTILQGQLSQALQNAPSGSEHQCTFADLLEEVQRLKSIVRKLLLFAQSDSGQLRLSQERVCLTDEVAALAEDVPLLAPGLTFNQELAPNVEVLADPDLLRQVIQNLFSNAVKYCREKGALECCLRQDAKTVTFTLANTTPPGLNIDRERLFDRFYRGDPSRNRRVDGSGLGLSLAREISRAHGGDLVIDITETRTDWLAFRLTLPRAG